jgi:hypothetical protein
MHRRLSSSAYDLSIAPTTIKGWLAHLAGHQCGRVGLFYHLALLSTHFMINSTFTSGRTGRGVFHLVATTIDSIPVNCSTYVSVKPASRIHPQQSAPV